MNTTRESKGDLRTDVTSYPGPSRPKKRLGYTARIKIAAIWANFLECCLGYRVTVVEIKNPDSGYVTIMLKIRRS